VFPSSSCLSSKLHTTSPWSVVSNSGSSLYTARNSKLSGSSNFWSVVDTASVAYAQDMWTTGAWAPGNRLWHLSVRSQGHLSPLLAADSSTRFMNSASSSSAGSSMTSVYTASHTLVAHKHSPTVWTNHLGLLPIHSKTETFLSLPPFTIESKKYKSSIANWPSTSVDLCLHTSTLEQTVSQQSI